jgi:hypothetical protein
MKYTMVMREEDQQGRIKVNNDVRFVIHANTADMFLMKYDAFLQSCGFFVLEKE